MARYSKLSLILITVMILGMLDMQNNNRQNEMTIAGFVISSKQLGTSIIGL